eukprot:CAMPEP_0113568548 /NCGR_PEP_ID=MMETSP0015_2-20120614/23909_1 /TAXON_ID=2838 /ORGANISM="Odontella" /LENGTH=207 /DNA_ID=CAMNT_0000471099 /DNA_START=144 /DNA_END=764 /DNA_ORIENTATION=+ /assembly_acc=CAM_ASM_000160
MSDDEEYEYEYDDDVSDDQPMGDGDGDGSQDASQEYDDDDEEDFEYTDEEEEADDVDVALENAYYNAKGLRDNPDELGEAAEAFEEVVRKEREALREQQRGDDDSDGDGDDGDGGEQADVDGDGGPYGQWSYKAIKQLVKLHLRTGDGIRALEQYRRLLRCAASGAVSPNAVEKGVNGMLERVSSLYQGGGAFAAAARRESDAGDGD